MTIVDRYLLSVFLKTFLICFASFFGLFLVIDGTGNADEIAAIAEADGLSSAIFDRYYPQCAARFNELAGVFILVAAIFSISLLQRNREVTAIEAAGISKLRIFKVVFVAASIIIAMTVLSREVLIPKVGDRLTMDWQEWTEWKTSSAVSKAFDERIDYKTGVAFSGDLLLLSKDGITAPEVRIPSGLGAGFQKIKAESAFFEVAESGKPSGFRFHKVNFPKEMHQLKSIESEGGETVVYTPRDFEWLHNNQCFVATDLNTKKLLISADAKYKSTPELIGELKATKKRKVNELAVELHSRFLKPVMDFTLLLLGLPLVIRKLEKNFVSGVLGGLGVIVLFLLVEMVCHSLGGNGLIGSPALSAWLPLMILFPVSLIFMRDLSR
jgi:lipopolysaccharide export system permease protein